MPTNFLYTALRNVDSVPLSHGMIVRQATTANNAIVRAQADSAPHLQGVVGVVDSGVVGINGQANVATASAEQDVLLETGLTPVPGDTLYISISTPGRGTNVAPGTVFAIGTILDASLYSQNSSVKAVIDIPSAVGSGSAFPGFGTGVAGPTALGSVGVASTARRSDQTAAAYRSDLPLSATWFIDPVAGSDTNAGTTSAAALQTAQELKRRWWGAEITSNTTVTVLDNVPPTDVGTWNVSIKPGVTVVFLGVLGPTTGAGGRAIDNTIYSGTVTNFAAASIAPAADDIELTDTTVPTSFTASGVLANGIILRRESGAGTADRWWFAAQDLGSKILRCSPIMNSTNSLSMNSALTINDTYKAYALKTMPMQNFGSAGGGLSGAGTVLYRFLRDNKAQNPIVSLGYMVRRDRSWVDHLGIEMMVITANCAFDATGGLQIVFPFQTPPQWSGGMVRGGGADVVAIFGQMGLGAPLVCQGAALKLFDGGYCTQEQSIAIHDVSVTAIEVSGGGRWIVQSLTVPTIGISGKGNTGKLVTVARGGQLHYGSGSASPPVVAGSSSDANPITIGTTDYAVAGIPATADVMLSPAVQFP